MTLMPRRLIAQQGSDAKVPAEDLRLALAGLFSPGVGANVARTGILRGSNAPGYTACQVLSPSGSTFTVKQGAFIVQQSTANGGAYIGIIDSDQTLTLTPPAAGQFQAGLVIAHCYDEAYGDSQDGFALEIVLGAAASSAGAAVYPTLPTNSCLLSGFTVTSAGSITLTTAPTYTGTHNGILPVLAGDTGAGIYDGQWRDEPVKGLQRWGASASVWVRPHPTHYGQVTAFPTAGVIAGDLCTRTDVAVTPTTWRYDGTRWRYNDRELLTFATVSARDAFTGGYTGLECTVQGTGQFVYDQAYPGWQWLRTWWMATTAVDPSYVAGLSGTQATLPGMSGSIFVPSGRSLELHFHALGHAAQGSIAHVFLYAGSLGSTTFGTGVATNQENWDTVDVWGDAVGASANVNWSVQGVLQTGTCDVRSDPSGANGGVYVRARIL